MSISPGSMVTSPRSISVASAGTEVGETPSRFVERVRTEAARRELESTADTLDVIAVRCGFGTAETLRRTFRRRLHTSPDAYRRRFATAPTTRSTP